MPSSHLYLVLIDAEKQANCDTDPNVRTMITFRVGPTKGTIRHLLLSHSVNRNWVSLPTTLIPLTTQEMPTVFRLQLHHFSSN